ncbi:MAG TPA: DUF222 domain-containing protein [Streptosporangiaceae bacterium]
MAAELIPAGFLPRTPPSSTAAPTTSRPGSGFESGGALDTCVPGESLARLADAATCDGGLAQLTDDELIGVVRTWRRLESWCSAGTLAAIAELARRRPAERTAPAAPGKFPAQLSEFIGDEVAAALTLSSRTAGAYLDLTLDLALRLPATARALREGVVDYLKARLIADLTRVLSDEDARAVEARILPAAGQQTTAQLRAAVSRAVIAADPEAATRRRQEAQKDPRVRRWQEDAGTAALGGFGLPPAEVLEADQRITERALALRDAGLPGSLEELRARAYLDTLLGQDASATAPSNEPRSPNASPSEPASQSRLAAPPSEPAPQSRLAAMVNLTIPLAAIPGEPGHVAGLGPVDPELARQLTGLAAAHPASRFCVTVTGDDGRALGHGCARGRPTGPFTVTISPLAQDTCDHRHQEPGYQPSRRLQHLINARTPTCSAPGCRQSATRCDLDHTVPYDQGGRTCECDLAPLCRHHHRCKQSEGWRLDQPRPGTLTWTTPAGRRYTTTPDGQSVAFIPPG